MVQAKFVVAKMTNSETLHIGWRRRPMAPNQARTETDGSEAEHSR